MQTRFLSRPTSLAYDPDSEGVTRGAYIEVGYVGIEAKFLSLGVSRITFCQTPQLPFFAK
jgi:hypothetical protein